MPPKPPSLSASSAGGRAGGSGRVHAAPGVHGDRRARAARDHEIHGVTARGLGGEQALGLARDGGIAGDPHALAHGHASEVRARGAEAEAPAAARPRRAGHALGAEHGAAGLGRVLGAAGVEDHAHAGPDIDALGLEAQVRDRGQGRGRGARGAGGTGLGAQAQAAGPGAARGVFLDEHVAAAHGRDPAEVHAAAAREPALDEGLVIAAAEEAVGEAAAVREGHAEEVAGERGGGLGGAGAGHGVAPAAIALDRGGHVLRAFLAALDLEAVHADLGQRGHGAHAGHVLGREQVLDVAQVADVAVHDEIVGHAAGLGALAAVGRAAAPGLAGEALAAPRHAQGAVDEDLELDVGLAGQAPDLGHGQLARDHHAGHAEIRGEARALGAGDGHLGGRVDLERRAHGPGQERDRGILHDDGVDAGRRDLAQDALHGR